MRILIVEDEPTLGQQLKSTLDLAHRQGAAGLHLLARARLVAARLRGGGHGQPARDERGGGKGGVQLAHDGCVPRRKALNKV